MRSIAATVLLRILRYWLKADIATLQVFTPPPRPGADGKVSGD
jgi:hypothetical protein